MKSDTNYRMADVTTKLSNQRAVVTTKLTNQKSAYSPASDTCTENSNLGVVSLSIADLT